MSKLKDNFDAVLHTLLNKPFIRFLFAGGVNAAFSYCSFAVLMFLTQNKEMAVTLNFVVAVAFNYLNSSKFVFRAKTNFKDVIKFYVVYLITYPINLLHLHITVDLMGWNTYFSQFVTLLYIPLISFVLQKKLIFRPKKED